MEYEVIVGNIGLVYRGSSFQEAKSTYSVYKSQSARGSGRAGGETVTLMKDGELQWEFTPKKSLRREEEGS